MKRYSATDKLEKAYFDMLENTHYTKITVSGIIRKADISRTTFYRHYVDIFDMHQKIADKFASRVIEECAKLVMKAHSEQDYFDGVLRVLNSQEKYIILISGKNGSRYFFEAMLLNAQKFVTKISYVFSEEQLFRLRFMTVAMIGVYVKDILEGREHNPKYIEICKKLLNYNESHGGHYADRC